MNELMSDQNMDPKLSAIFRQHRNLSHWKRVNDGVNGKFLKAGIIKDGFPVVFYASSVSYFIGMSQCDALSLCSGEENTALEDS